MKYQAIIWDCDGVLIDSEILACKVSAEMLTEHGYPVTLEDYLVRFMGKSRAQILREAGVANDSFPVEDLRQRQRAAFAASLQAIPGVEEFLSAAALPMAVASGSERERLDYTLGLTGLDGYFKGHIYSAEAVKNGKPAPDIFILAAEKLGIAPKDCLVVEDSPNGVRAGKAAGMTVFAFTGGSHMTPAIEQALRAQNPDQVFGRMSDLAVLTS
jgi:HAD superfamily hydrolase (TIGR01509 family)